MTTETTSAVAIRRQQIEEHHRLALRYAEKVRSLDLRGTTYAPPPTDDIRAWCPMLQWAAYEVRYIYHSDICTQLEMGRGPYWCAMCQLLRDRPKGHRLMPCWPCWWGITGYDDAVTKARSISRHQWCEPFMRPTEWAS